jgi:hypothetical protein
VFTLFVITIAAAEVGIALAVVLLLFRRRGDVDIRLARSLAEGHDTVPADSVPAGSAARSDRRRGRAVTDLAWAARLVVLLPVLAAFAGMLVPRSGRRPAGGVAVAGTTAALAAAIWQVVATRGDASVESVSLLGPVPTGVGTVSLDLRADQLSAVVAVMVCVVALCVQVYSTAYQEHDKRYRAYAATVSLFTAAMLLVVQADDLLLLLIGGRSWACARTCSSATTASARRPARRRSRRS